MDYSPVRVVKQSDYALAPPQQIAPRRHIRRGAICMEPADLLRAHDAAEVGGRAGVAREDLRESLCAQVADGHLPEDGAEVRGQRQVAVLVELLRREAGPFAQNLAAVHRPTERKEAGGVPVVGSVVPVLARCAAE